MENTIKTIAKKRNINIEVGLDASNLPISIIWEAADEAQQSPNRLPAKAMLLSLFDRETKDTLRIDLWTTDMQINEMDRFVFQTLRSLADTYYKATQNRNLAADMQRFVEYFGEQTEILPKQNA